MSDSSNCYGGSYLEAKTTEYVQPHLPLHVYKYTRTPFKQTNCSKLLDQSQIIGCVLLLVFNLSLAIVDPLTLQISANQAGLKWSQQA